MNLDPDVVIGTAVLSDGTGVEFFGQEAVDICVNALLTDGSAVMPSRCIRLKYPIDGWSAPDLPISLTK